MRRLVVVLLAGGVSVLLASPAFAVRPGAVRRVSETANVTAVTVRSVVQSVRGAYVHSLALLCTTAPCEVALYDSTADGAANSGAGTLRWEGRVASNNGTYVQDFDAPLAFTEGLTLEVSGVGGSAFVAWE